MPVATTNGIIHQPLLLRSCSRLIEAAAKNQANTSVIRMVATCGNSAALTAFSPSAGSMDAEMPMMSMATGPVAMPKASQKTVSNSSAASIDHRMTSVASQYLPRLMRPSKRDSNHLVSTAASGRPEMAGGPEYWSHAPALGSIPEHFRAKHALGLDPWVENGSRQENVSNQ